MNNKSKCNYRNNPTSENNLEHYGFLFKPADKKRDIKINDKFSINEKIEKSNLEPVLFNTNYKMKYPDESAYHFPTGKSNLLSPCMSSYSKPPIEKKVKREE
jgi:hypothetical protein